MNPTNLTVCAGNLASFSAAASGTPVPTLQWQADGGSGLTNIPDQEALAGETDRIIIESTGDLLLGYFRLTNRYPTTPKTMGNPY